MGQGKETYRQRGQRTLLQKKTPENTNVLTDKRIILLNSMENNIATKVSEISRTFIFAVWKN